jgi:murein DD-endopeptidase MepM/ murein hydrolase activator NlpD
MAVAGWLILAGCTEATDLAQRLVDRRPARQRYLDGLVQAGLGDAAMVRDWIAAGDRAFADAPTVTSPHREEVDLPPNEAGAIGLKIELKRGQLVRFEVSLPADTLATIFLDTRYAGASGDSLGPATAESHRGERFVSFEPRRDGWYVFRAQPELFRGGRFAVALSIAPMLAFPVSGRGESAILSKWGAPRDGGRRLHHGVDIFAPRGTPVIAAASGRVVEVGENELGGLVVWLRDERGYTQYYAHLSTQLVTTGASVTQGDTIGLVGNTGNARTTPPHLHFGVYRRGEGPIDPFWFFHKPPGTVARLAVDTSLLGGYARSRVASAVVRRGPRPAADTLRVLGRTDSVRVVAAIGGWYRVRLDDGAEGYLIGRSAERLALDEPPAPRGTGVVTAP